MYRRIVCGAGLALVLAVASVGPVAGQANRGPSAGAALVEGVSDSAVLAGVVPRTIGPAVMSGRISDIAVQTPTRSGERWGRVIYAASAAGGAWKSTNGGKTWIPITDGIEVGSTGAIAVAPSDSNIVYLGSGESNNLRSSSWGNGVYRSADGGRTWTHVGLATSQHVPRILVHPRDPNTVYVAAMGPLWGSGGERGVYKTTDGGRTWNAVKTINATTGFTDLAFDPANPEIIYAVAYERERKAWSFVAGGPNTGVWKSEDGGATWREINNGLPAGDKGRSGIAVAASQPRTLYVSVHHADSSGLYRSDDGGENWRRMSNISSIPWFFGQVRVDPKNPERVYYLGVQLQVSDDGGRNWRTIGRSIHVDHHAMWIDPDDPAHMINGNDGGLYISHDYGETWDFAENLPVSTFYAIGYDMQEPYRVYGGLQDNGSWGAPNTTRTRAGVLHTDWQRVGGGDGFYTQVDPLEPHIMYSESQNGAVNRVNVRLGEQKSIRPQAEPGEQLRWNWATPILISPHDNRTIYIGAQKVFRSTDRGDTWSRISDDVTRNLDRDTLPIMGLRQAGGLGRHDGTAQYGNIATLDESPLRRGVLYAGTDDGVIAISEDDGGTWRQVTSFPGVPDLTYVSRVIASRHDAATVYATFDGHRDNDFRPYVLKSTDHGRTWTSIAANLPDYSSVQVIREHHENPDLLFVGNEHGVWMTTNGGASWSKMPGLPTVAVHDLLIHPRDNDLIVGTHGRGIYIYDDLTPLVRLAEAAAASRPATVFAPPAATVFFASAGPSAGSGDRLYAGENEPFGALLSYFVKPSAGDGLSLAIVDERGGEVRTLEAATTPGLHRTEWDLRHEPVVVAESGGQGQGGGGFFGSRGVDGPLAAPGSYRVQLRSGGQVVHEATLTVRADPLVDLTAAEYRTLVDARMEAYRLQKQARALGERLEEARARLEAARASADTTQGPGQAARQLERELETELARVCGPRGFAQCGAGGGGFGGGGGQQGIFQRATAVANAISSTHFLPTPSQRDDLAEAARAAAEAGPRAEAVLGRVDAAVRAVGAR